jgi:uncharacterized protein (TIGR02466 family)
MAEPCAVDLIALQRPQMTMKSTLAKTLLTSQFGPFKMGHIMVQNLFPSFVYQSALASSAVAQKSSDKLNRELLDEAYKISKIDAAGHEWSEKNYPGGYTSYGSMGELHRFSSTFGELQKLIDSHVAQFVRHLELSIKPQALRMQTCWVNIMPKSVVHTMHIHPLSVISGTYYVKIPKGASGLKFEDPRMGFFMASPARKPNAKIENQRFVTLKPQAGQVVLFESWMRHEVPPNPVASERVSISFNYDWVP